MTFDQIVDQARDALTVKRVFGEPYERDGVTVIPAASIRGGGGGGSGEDTHGSHGGGGGFGVTARPVGAYVVRDGDVRWEPAVDVTRIVLTGQAIAILFMLVLRGLVRRRRKR